MEEELNYLTEKIEDLVQDRNYYDRQASKAENEVDIEHNSGMAEKRNKEIKYLNNILTIFNKQT